MVTYRAGESIRVFVDGHAEPALMRPIYKDGFCSGGGVLLLIDRGDGEINKIVNLLNREELNENK